MKLDTIALLLVVFGGAVYLFFLMFAGLAAPFPIWIVFLVVMALVGFLLFRVIWQRKNNADDDYYERNVDK